MFSRQFRKLVVASTIFNSALFAVALTIAVTRGETKKEDAKAAIPEDALVLVVMDPLSAPLSCPCVEGYAQRKYEVLGKYLEAKTNRKVAVVFAEALSKALKDTGGRADLIVGKDSVVRSDGKKANLETTAVASLTGKDGKTTQNGLIVVRSDDPAKTIKDLAGYRIFLGPADCTEKHQAAIQLLDFHKVALPKKFEIDNACSDGAGKVVELGAKTRSAAVISSYAAPLLEGCGTIKKGDLRVLGKTKPVPFVTVFATNHLDEKTRAKVEEALFSSITEPDLLIAMESLLGFVPIVESDVETDNAKKK
jgi:ABC-type phosphate/phosphonate transport system substrate-binding protein